MMEFTQPPPNLSIPSPNLATPPPNIGLPMQPHMPYNHHNRLPFRPFSKPLPGPLGNMTLEDFDGKRLRKSVMRKTVDYNSSVIKELENRIWQRDYRDRRGLQPDAMYYPDLMPPPSYLDNPINCVTTRFVKTATNKMRCPIFCMAWTSEGRRLVTGASSGEFTLWNGLTFNFETILQAHDSPVRTMVWSHNDSWMVTGDHAGYVKYWQSNMNNVKVFQAHKEALRGISFSPSDSKFVTCSDDGTLRIWDFFRYQEERVLRGHGADVKCVHWHPQKGLIISGSKDNQQPIKLWDPKTGQSLATLHAHKSTVMDLKWNSNGNWLITASRDHLLKLFDLRNLSQEVQTFRGHKKEASSVAWHPIHEGLFASGGSDGAIVFWHVGADKEVGSIEQAHDSIVWTLAWHPLGHILCSGSNDHTSKFWTRNRPGDQMRDKYNLNTQPGGIAGFDDMEIGDELNAIIPGMGPEDKVEITALIGDENTAIPGLDLDSGLLINEEKSKPKKVPFSKPIPRNFQAQWNETLAPENTPGVVPLEKITANALIMYGKVIPVQAGSRLEKAISEGPEVLQKFIESGAIEELNDVMPKRDPDEEEYLRDTNHEEIEKMHNNISGCIDDDDDIQFCDDDDMRISDQEIRNFNKTDIDISYGDTDFRKPKLNFEPPPNIVEFELNDSSFAPSLLGQPTNNPLNYNAPIGRGRPGFGPIARIGNDFPQQFVDNNTYRGDEDFRNNSRSSNNMEYNNDAYEEYGDDYNNDNDYYEQQEEAASNNWHRNNFGPNNRIRGIPSLLDDNWSNNFRGPARGVLPIPRGIIRGIRSRGRGKVRGIRGRGGS